MSGRKREVRRPAFKGPTASRVLREAGIITEAWVEEARVVGAKLTAARVICGHLSSISGRYPQAIQGEQQIEPLGPQDDPGPMFAGLAEHVLPEPARLIVADLTEVNNRAVVLC